MAKTDFPPGGIALVVGGTGGIGGALTRALAGDPRFSAVVGAGRAMSGPVDLAIDLLDEAGIAAAAARLARGDAPLRLVIVATGILHEGDMQPERGWREIDPEAMARAFATNATGPALLMKHLLPLLPRDGKSVFAALSARVGSIGDNALGGWYAYRASKAALNQLVRTGAIELRRRHPDAVCVALHPGTVDTRLSAPFAKRGLDVTTPGEAARRLLDVIDRLEPADSGAFLDYRGERLPW
jgi:NAD(P)-dependent dehydrogenase (short-subunit alcohol dehydrogenase family)